MIAFTSKDTERDFHDKYARVLLTELEEFGPTVAYYAFDEPLRSVLNFNDFQREDSLFLKGPHELRLDALYSCSYKGADASTPRAMIPVEHLSTPDYGRQFKMSDYAFAIKVKHPERKVFPVFLFNGEQTNWTMDRVLTRSQHLLPEGLKLKLKQLDIVVPSWTLNVGNAAFQAEVRGDKYESLLMLQNRIRRMTPEDLEEVVITARHLPEKERAIYYNAMVKYITDCTP